MHAIDVSDNSTQPFGSPLDEARRLLDSYSAGGAQADDLSAGLVHLCGADPEASWAVLAWLDQYHRRGILETDLFRDLKERIARLAVPVQEVPLKAPPPDQAASVEVEDRTVRRDEASLPILLASEPIEQTVVVDPEPPAVPAAKFGPGTVLRGRYELINELGRGGMGAVYRARDRERLGLTGLPEFVALKVLRDDWVSRPDALASLRQECFRAQSLSHPNIVNVYDWDRDDSTCFVTMELVDGEPLSRILDRIRPRRLARRHALAIIDVVGQALVYAHANGVVHADLKPANVMIGHDGRVRVLDFGLARPVLREPSIGGDGGMALMRAATPAYASPEVLRGVNAVPRDDIFSFACLTYELLGGVPPFERQTVSEARRGRPMPPRPEGCSAREWRVLRKALAPQREDRPASISALLEELLPDDVEPVPALKSLLEGAHEKRPAVWRWLLLMLFIVAAAGVGYLAYEGRLPLTVSAQRTSGTAVGVPREPTVPQPERAPAAPVSETVEHTAAAQHDADSDTAVIEPARPATVEPASVDASREDEALIREPVEPPAAAQPSSQTAAPAPAAVASGPARVTLVPDSLTISESGGAARLVIERRGPLDDALDVRWWTEPAEASSDDDYADFGTRTERFAPGQSRITILVPIVADAVPESTETFSVLIAPAVAGVRTEVGRATVIVVDDD